MVIYRYCRLYTPPYGLDGALRVAVAGRQRHRPGVGPGFRRPGQLSVFAFASIGADQGEDGSGAGGGARVANEFGGVNYDGDAGGEAAGTGFGAGSGAFLGIPGQNPFYGVGAGGGAGPIGTGVGCFGFYTADDPTPTCNIN